jgi:TnsE C-terminal domain
MPITIKGFDENVEIIHLGDFFRFNGKVEWNLYLRCDPPQKKKSTRLSHLPMLSRGRYINSSTPQSHRRHVTITIDENDQLIPTTLAEFPEINHFPKLEGAQTAFRLEKNHIGKVIIPQLELARAIFLANSYLCRACMNAQTLLIEFKVEPNPELDHVDIHVLPSSTFPMSAFDESGTRKLLAWLLICPPALNSYRSIYRNYQTNRWVGDESESWTFSFEPPPMANWELMVHGRPSADGKYFLVNEISGIVFDIDMPQTVTFISPNFVKNNAGNYPGNGKADGAAWKSDGDEFTLDDEQSASDKNETLVLDDDSSWIRFSKPFMVYKKERVKNSKKPLADGETETIDGNIVSTDEPHLGGSLPSASIGGKLDATDQSSQFVSRFQCFDHMLQVLVAQHECKILEQETVALPSYKKSQHHLLKDGSARAIKFVRIQRHLTQALLLEVDTSDDAKKLSTKVAYDKSPENWAGNFLEIQKGVVSKSLAWPNDILNDIFGENNHSGVNHPKSHESQPGNIPIDAIEGWSARIAEKMSDLKP